MQADAALMLKDLEIGEGLAAALARIVRPAAWGRS